MILYGLHEKVLQKELLSESQPSIINNSVTSSKKGKMSLQVQFNAKQELNQICVMPTGSHKWTWGLILTKKEVQFLHHISKKHVQSGYKTSLKDGQNSGESSLQGSLPKTTGINNYSLIGSEVENPPSFTFLDIPSHFSSSNFQGIQLDGRPTSANSISAHNPIPPLQPPALPSNSVSLSSVHMVSDQQSKQPQISDSLAFASITDKWINMESDNKTDSPLPQQQSLPFSVLANQWINMEIDEESISANCGADIIGISKSVSNHTISAFFF